MEINIHDLIHLTSVITRPVSVFQTFGSLDLSREIFSFGASDTVSEALIRRPTLFVILMGQSLEIDENPKPFYMVENYYTITNKII